MIRVTEYNVSLSVLFVQIPSTWIRVKNRDKEDSIFFLFFFSKIVFKIFIMFLSVANVLMLWEGNVYTPRIVNEIENKQNNYLDNSLNSNKHISCNILKIFPPIVRDKNPNLKYNTKWMYFWNPDEFLFSKQFG